MLPGTYNVPLQLRLYLILQGFCEKQSFPLTLWIPLSTAGVAIIGKKVSLLTGASIAIKSDWIKMVKMLKKNLKKKESKAKKKENEEQEEKTVRNYNLRRIWIYNYLWITVLVLYRSNATVSHP